MSDKPKNKVLSRQQELMSVFDFTMHDLAANRVGVITEPHKRAVLKRERRRWRLGNIMGGLIVALFMILFLTVLVDKLNRPYGVIPEAISAITLLLWVFGFSCIPLILVVLLPFVVPGLFVKYRIGNELKREQVAVIQGITVVDTTGNRRVYGEVTVNNIKLSARRDAVLSIKHLEPHIVYYLPRSKVILSVETIGE